MSNLSESLDTSSLPLVFFGQFGSLLVQKLLRTWREYMVGGGLDNEMFSRLPPLEYCWCSLQFGLPGMLLAICWHVITIVRGECVVRGELNLILLNFNGILWSHLWFLH